MIAKFISAEKDISKPRNFTSLLIALLIMLIAVPITADINDGEATLFLNIIYVVSFGFLAWHPLVSKHKFKYIYISLFGLGACCIAAGNLFGMMFYDVVMLVVLLLICITTIFDIGKRVMFPHKINMNDIMGSICLYLLIGLAFATINNLLLLIDESAFANIKDEAKDYAFMNFVYYSYVTMTTLGYGDILPTSYTARSIATIVTITGQFYVAIVVAGLVSAHLSNPSED